MFKDNINITYSGISTQSLLETTVNLLVEEQIRNKDNSKALEKIYSEFKIRERLDIYNEATSLASKKAVALSDILYEFKNSEIKEIATVLPSDLLKRINESPNRYKNLSAKDYLPFLSNDKKVYVANVVGDSMIGANIFDGDEAIFVMNEDFQNKDIVIADFEGDIIIKRYIEKNDEKWLYPENEKYLPYKITGEYKVEVVGVVKSIIRKV